MEIRPFSGFRYAVGDGDVSAFIAPPYDVLTQADKSALLTREARNIVAVDLPHCPPAGVGPDSAYAAAAATLRAWRADGVMARDAAPCLYAYQQAYAWAGKTYRRRTLIAAVKLEAFGEGVWPHERTFAGTRADRMKLNLATGMQLSPVFGFYEDSDAVAEAVFAAAGAPDAAGTLDGVDSCLWAVSDPDAIAAVQAALAGRDLFIADGHHRYTSALDYRDRLGPLPPDHPANFVMFVLAAMSDPGLIVLPAHRVLRGLRDFDLDRFVASAHRVMEFTRVRLGGDDVADAGGFLRRRGRHAMAFAAGQDAYVGRLKDLAVMDRVAGDRPEAWRELDVAILHRLLIDDYLADNKTNEMFIEYLADGRAALSAVKSGQADLAVFLQATPLDAVRDIALAGDVMPHKSTYFYPKPATGMVLYPLE